MDKIKLAILGLGSRSTLFYLKELNKLYQKEKGGFSTCPFLLLNADFDKINPLLPNPSADLEAIMKSYFTELEKLNTEYILVPNITLHETIDSIEIHKTILHPLPLTVSKIIKMQRTKIVLFGSLHSMQSDYIRSYFEANGIAVLLPNQDEMLLIDEVRKQIYRGTESEELIDKYHSLISHYTKDHAVVLGCTELSILKQEGNSAIFDMAEIQLEEAIRLLI